MLGDALEIYKWHVDAVREFSFMSALSIVLDGGGGGESKHPLLLSLSLSLPLPLSLRLRALRKMRRSRDGEVAGLGWIDGLMDPTAKVLSNYRLIA